MKMSFFTLFFTITSLMIFCISTIIPVHSQCLEDQRSLLLQLKNSLEFDPPSSVMLVNWTRSNDCCQWKGVTCDQDGHVTGLDLNSESILGGISNSSSLFSLQFLEKLNLANNFLSHWNANFTSFIRTQMPSGFGNLTSLTHLNLSEAGFAGQIPIELSRLTRLVTLDLSTYFQEDSLQLENPNLSTLLQNLTGLTELHLDGVNISSQGSEWCQAISSSLPNLRVLSLSNCYLSGPIDSSLQKLQFLSEIDLSYNDLSAPVPEFFAKFANLTALSLGYSNLYGRFPEKIFQMANLQTLDFEGNEFLGGSLPEFPQNGSIRNLVLSETSFSGRLPESLGNLAELSRIEIPRCNFSGPIPNSLANLRQLVSLDLSNNNFGGAIPSFQSSKNLRYVYLSHNALTGPIPSTHFEGLLNLVYVDLAYNSFNGSIPSSLFTLQSLQNIQLSNNKFDEVTAFPNGSLSPLDSLDLSSNKLKGPIPLYFFDFRGLNVLSLSFNNFNGTVQLESIQRLQNLTELHLSYNSLSVNASISNSSLSSFPQLRILRLASCKLQEFPPLENQTILGNLDLSKNQISGEIPNWIWNVGNGSLNYLNLSSNLLVELQRPYTIPSLYFLDLHSNQLCGKTPIPPDSAVYVDYSSNNFSSSVPAGIGNNLKIAQFFSLSNNSLTGAIPQSVCNASNLQVLDLSNNRLTGTIPQCLIDSGTATLGVLNLRNNNLTGSIRGTFPEVCALETLDVNGNQLEGQVPKSLANCTNLEVLNLGNNKMNGNFPCFLKNSSSLRIFVLRSNKFQGSIHCRGIQRNIWPKLQIIDLALNNFSGDLPPKVFLHWKAMMLDGGNAQPDLDTLRFHLINNWYYQYRVTLSIKGRQMELVKILTIFTSIDLSSNNFGGEIPDTLGALEFLYLLNLSHNALIGLIPSSFGNLSQLESLDLSQNKLNGSIPSQLASLTFLSFLNLSYNQLVGMIPRGSQFQTFTETSFQGNPGLYRPPLNPCCVEPELPGSPRPTADDVHSEINWVYISATLGYSMGFGVVVGPLFYCKKWRTWHDKHVDWAISRVVLLEDRQAGYQRRRENRNLVRRRQNR